MRKTTAIVASALALVTGSTARADIVEASSTTLLTVGQQTRGGAPGTKPELADVAPLFEILSVSARDISNPIADNLQVVLSTWGSYDLADRRWDNGTGSNLTGDVTTGYLRGELLARHLVLTVGRQYVAQGVARMVQLDGGEAIVQLPLGLGLSGYAGSPVSQRFASRGELVTWNPAGGDLAYGGRLFWRHGLPGAAGRGVELGVSTAYVSDSGDVARNDVGFDLRFEPVERVTVTANGTWSVAESKADGAGKYYELWRDRLAEFNVGVTVTPIRKLHVTVDFRRIAPDLFLPRTSVLSVFSDKERTGAGGSVSYELLRGLTLAGELHLDTEPESTDSGKTFLGKDAALRVAWKRGATSLGAEGTYLDAAENGYLGLRAFARQELGDLFAAVDVLENAFRDPINGEKNAATATLTGGYTFARGWSAVVSARAGATPFMEQQLDVMAKLVYNQTYRVREVR